MAKKVTARPPRAIIRTTVAPVIRRASTVAAIRGETEHTAGSFAFAFRLYSKTFAFVGALDADPHPISGERAVEIGFDSITVGIDTLRALSVVAGDLADRMARANALPRHLERDE